MKVTPKTLTDGQIRELILDHPALVVRALDDAAWMKNARHSARVQIAAIINARAAKAAP